MRWPPLISTLFPYTTLFRSCHSKLDSSYPVLARRTNHLALHWINRGMFVDLRHYSSWVRRSEEHTSELQSHSELVCRLLLEKKKKIDYNMILKETNSVAHAG